jgi:hypothetical protein
VGEHYGLQYCEDFPQPSTTLIIYDAPQIAVVPHYSKTVVPNVDPIEYSNRYGDDLLDFSAILDWCRRLNIPEHVVTNVVLRVDFCSCKPHFT